jgi:hypothetical protein
MIRISEFIKTSKRVYIFALLLFMSIFVFYSCFILKSLDHPTTAETNSFFDVTFVCEHTDPVKTEGRGYFGALLPKGWRVRDYTDYTVHFSNPDDNIYGRLCYDQYYTDRLTANFPAPDGYYWWGGRSIDELELLHSDENKSDDFTFTFRVFTDNKTGEFALRYVIGTDGDNEDPADNGMYVDEQRTITITQGSQFPLYKASNWELLPNRGEEADVKFYADKDYNGFFTRWNGWTGGDIGRSAPLGDGRSVWVWGDSHTGYVLSDRTRKSDKAQFERNFIILQEGEDFSAFKLLNEGSPGGTPPIKEIVIPTDDNGDPLGKYNEWYWPQGTAVYYRNGVPELQMLVARTKNDGSGGMWGMEGVSADVAVFSLPELKLTEIKKYRHLSRNIEKNGSRFGLDFGGYVFKDDDGVVYIYGYCDIEGICTRYGLVARVTDGDLTGDWEFYNAVTQEWSTDTSWQDNLADWEGATVANDPVFVFKDAGKYYGITQPGRCFSDEIVIYEAETPYGPFKNSKRIGRLPAEISTENNYFCSLLAIHPQYSQNGEIFFSVSKNYQGDKTWYDIPGSADTYLPYFFRVKDWRDNPSIAEQDATDNKGVLTAQYEENKENLTDNDATTIYSVNAGKAWIQYESPSPVNLRRYTITSAPDSPAKDPLHWKVSGSNDGTNWVVLDERYYAEFEHRSQTINYNVPVDGNYTYFRFDILASKEGPGLQIAEWQLFGNYKYSTGTVAALESVTVNGEPVTIQDIMVIDLPAASGSSFTVDLKTEDNGRLEGVENNFTVKLEQPGISIYTIKVISEDEKTEKEYKLIFNKRFAFDDLIEVKWNNTLMLYLNKLKGYNVTGYQWYQDGSPIAGAAGTSYSVGPKINDRLSQTSAYHVVVKTSDGDLRSEAEQVTLKSMSIQAYPNPVKSSESVTVEADIDEGLLQNSTIEIFNIQGDKLNTVSVRGRSTVVNMPFTSGAYMLRFKANNDFEKTLKVVVK